MGKFYTSVIPYGDTILHRGVDENGERFSYRESFSPRFYVPAKAKTKFRSLEGQYLEEVSFGGMGDARDFIKRYNNVPNFEIFGNIDYVYQFIGDSYAGDIDYDLNKVVIAFIDIETTCELGFPDVRNPEEQVNAITMRVGDRRWVFGLGEFHIDDENIECFAYDEEEQLLDGFITKWREIDPDVVTGWNVKFFDIPYLVSRIDKLLGSSAANLLSPWKRIREKNIGTMNGDQLTYEIQGVATLDYYDLYKKFTFVNQESYRLDHIAFVELGERKLSYEEFDSMSEFYKKDFQKFVEYNVKDTDLVYRLEEKMKLLELSFALAYSAKVNFNDVFSQVRTWDCIIYHYLRDHNIMIPPKKNQEKQYQYEGAYVKEPIAGIHDWIASFDLNSLYPHLIMQYNISPETKVDMPIVPGNPHCITANNILLGSAHHMKGPQKCDQELTKRTQQGYSVAANGTCYTKEYQGFLPSLMDKLYQERKMYKKKMIECQKRQQAGEDMGNEIAKYNNFQMVRKIQLNSAYGAIGNQYFRYFDVQMAEAITTSGQLSIRWIADHLNAYLNKTVETEDYDYVVASDTDSVYLRLGNLVDKVCGGKSKSEVVDFLDKACEQIIEPYIEKAYNLLAVKMNAFANKMIMGREVIADKGVWTAKKRYMLNVHDSEGVRYAEPKLKIMGIETTRSSTPQVVRDALKETIALILQTDNDTVIDYIDKFRKEFKSLPIEDIAFPRGVKGLKKYHCPSHIYKKSTPIAVKGSLIFNRKLKDMGLDKKYTSIREGDKIKFVYLKVPNLFGERVISFSSGFPKEFELDRFVNYDMQFEKAYLEPLSNILDTINWHTERINTLESLFG